MREGTFFGIMFALLFGLMILAFMGSQEAILGCETKGGVLVQTYSGDDLCINKEAIIK